MKHHTDESLAIIQDQHRTQMSTLLLCAASISQAWLAGWTMTAHSQLFSLQGKPWPTLPAMMAAALLIMLAKGTHQARTQYASLGALLVAILALPAAIFQLPWLGLAYITSAFLIWRGAQALQRTHQQLHEIEQIAPMQHFTRAALAILIKAMGADGHFDQRERQMIRQFCRDAGFSGTQQQVLRHEATTHSQQPIPTLVNDYILAARHAHIHQPDQLLLSLLRDIIESDGIVVPEEASFLLEIGRELNADQDQIHEYLERVQQELACPSPELARQLLNVPMAAQPQIIDRAYEALAQAIQRTHSNPPHHRPGHHALYTRARLNALQRAYQTITHKPSKSTNLSTP